MTITISIEFICYWIFTVIFEAIYIFILWEKFKKKTQEHKFVMMLKEAYKNNVSLKLIYKMIFSPLGFFLGFCFLSIVSPVMFLFSLLTLFKKIIGYKSKLEKEAEKQSKEDEEAIQRSKEFMKKEGCEIEGEIHIDVDKETNG